MGEELTEAGRQSPPVCDRRSGRRHGGGVWTKGQAHYLLHVMRAKAGNRVLLFNGRDGEWLAEIAQAGQARRHR